MATTDGVKPKAIGVDGAKIVDISCAACKEKGTNTNGQYHCKYCGVMCENCSSSHEKMPKKGHWAMKLKTVVQLPPVPTFKSFTKCELHKAKLNRYCIDCGELLCEHCLEESHTECATESVDNLSAKVVRDKDLREARLQLEDLRVRNNKARKRKRNEMKNLAKQADDFVNSVLKVREKINALFDKMLELIIIDKNDFCNAEAQLIEDHILKSSEIDPVFDSARLVLNDAYKSSSKQNIWVAIKKIDKLMIFYENIIAQIEADKCDVRFEFVPSESLTNILKEAENIGKMKVISARLNVDENKSTEKQIKREIGVYSNKNGKREPTLGNSRAGQVQHPSPWSYNNTPRSSRAVTKLPAIRPNDRQQSMHLNLRPLSNNSTRSKTMDSIDLRSKSLTSRHRTNTSIYLNSNTSRYSNHSRLRIRLNVPPKRYSIEEDETERNIGETFGEMQGVKLSVLGRKEIRVPEDSIDNCITGSVFLKNGRLVLVDYNNKTVKLYTSDIALITCLVLEERPWDVTACHKSDIAISFPFINNVEIYNTGADMTRKSVIQTDRKCHGLAYDRQNKFLYVACGEGIDARIHAYSLDGFIRRLIIPEEGVLHEPCFLAMSFDNKHLFVSDLDNGLVGFDVDSGALLCQYKDPKVKRYWGLTTDIHGHVFIVTTGPDCLYAIMGEYNGQLLKKFEEDENKVCSVTFDPITNRLLVSRWQSEEIEMFHVVYR